MKRRPFVQGTSVRKQVLRQRRIYTTFAASWEALRSRAEQAARDDVRKPAPKPA
jgi:hypothetical protein